MIAEPDRPDLSASDIPVFGPPYAPPDEEIAARLLDRDRFEPAGERRIDALATRLIEAIRAGTGGLGGVEDFLHAYSLSTREGLALMVLAEALLRVPDAATADRLIEEKLAAGDWSTARSPRPLVAASAWTLGVTARIIHPGETPETVLDGLIRRLGLPAVRAATRQAMRLLGSHFVLGQTIDEALARAAEHAEELYSFDMLGEGARTEEAAQRHSAAYDSAIAAIGRIAGNRPLAERPEISVKLSALHPRFEAVSRARVLVELVPRLTALMRRARSLDLNLTIDAEEADRLELMLDVIGEALGDLSLGGWDGFGLAVQAYSKRAEAVIDWAAAVAEMRGQRLSVRLVKGAYWDTEVKRAQERGLADYPVFTRKPMTDLCYLVCARKLLAARPRLYPQFATHNALTVANIVEMAGGVDGYEFQRLHGMGEVLYATLREAWPQVACRVYAPVGNHKDLLAYLVRRLLENGANSSFVSVAADPDVPVATLLARPRDRIGAAAHARNPHIPLPRDLYGGERCNSRGIEFGDRAGLEAVLDEIRREASQPADAASIVDGIDLPGKVRAIYSPIDGREVGQVAEGDEAIIRSALAAAADGFADWSTVPVAERAAVLERVADLMEENRGRLIGLVQVEGGRTLDDAFAELREAVDFCRYYAVRARIDLTPQALPGPTGESNTLTWRGRGVFVCISPWNFPLAIFTGQIAAALVAGNAAVAKPAEQTPLVAAEVIRLMHRAGVPADALHFVPGDGTVGAAMVADPRVAGVAFTGSIATGHAINRALAAKEGPIVPLIAETGGINAMIVDATALPEQVTDDVLSSAFRSAGQRCSALRLLCVQDDVADAILEMIAGAAHTLTLGDPREPATHVGPVIDCDAYDRLVDWIKAMQAQGRVRFGWDHANALPKQGLYIPPTIIALDSARDLKEEVFGPILHVVRWRADALDALLDDIAANGTALTLGVQSRIEATADKVTARLPHGNVYVNRSMIGAVVGTQPFGGTGLSGTGPKAGGPNYLRRFAIEQVVTINTAAAGGNVTLLAGGGD